MLISRSLRLQLPNSSCQNQFRMRNHLKSQHACLPVFVSCHRKACLISSHHLLSVQCQVDGSIPLCNSLTSNCLEQNTHHFSKKFQSKDPTKQQPSQSLLFGMPASWCVLGSTRVCLQKHLRWDCHSHLTGWRTEGGKVLMTTGGVCLRGYSH